MKEAQDINTSLVLDIVFSHVRPPGSPKSEYRGKTCSGKDGSQCETTRQRDIDPPFLLGTACRCPEKRWWLMMKLKRNRREREALKITSRATALQNMDHRRHLREQSSTLQVPTLLMVCFVLQLCEWKLLVQRGGRKDFGS